MINRISGLLGGGEVCVQVCSLSLWWRWVCVWSYTLDIFPPVPKTHPTSVQVDAVNENVSRTNGPISAWPLAESVPTVYSRGSRLTLHEIVFIFPWITWSSTQLSDRRRLPQQEGWATGSGCRVWMRSWVEEKTVAFGAPVGREVCSPERTVESVSTRGSRTSTGTLSLSVGPLLSTGRGSFTL